MLLMRITKARLRFECDNKCKIVLRFTQLVRIIILLTLGMYQVEVQAAKIATNKKKSQLKSLHQKTITKTERQYYWLLTNTIMAISGAYVGIVISTNVPF